MGSLAIIPARHGSLRLPGKNTRLIGGKPMVQWTIEAALQSTSVDSVLVSSDDPEVLNVARAAGVSLVVKRPPALAAPGSSSADVVRHALTAAQAAGLSTDVICLLQPTSPARNSGHVDEAFDLKVSREAAAVVSVCELDHPLAWCVSIDESQRLGRLSPAGAHLAACYRLNGAIYIVDRRTFEEHGEFSPAGTLGYVMPRHYSVDVDTQYDFDFACALMANLYPSHP